MSLKGDGLTRRRARGPGLIRCPPTYLPRALAERVDRVAQAKNVSFSAFVRETLAIRVGRPELAQ